MKKIEKKLLTGDFCEWYRLNFVSREGGENWTEKRMFRILFDQKTKLAPMATDVWSHSGGFDSAGISPAVGDQPGFANKLERAGKI